MAVFDVSKAWVILVPPGVPAAGFAAEELVRCITALRGNGAEAPPLWDASGDAPEDEVPIILLNAGEDGPEWSGFTWRIGQDRLEIYGDSGRGLCNGVMDFLGALGIRWERIGGEDLPPLRADGIYPLKEGRGYVHSVPEARRRRLVLSNTDILRHGEEAARWAARNRIDVLVISLREKAPLPARVFGLLRQARNRLLRAAKQYGLVVEAGGWDLSLLVPRRYFLFRRELFRMSLGKRRADYNFCPTNPETLRILKREAGRLFKNRPGIGVFHLWPDRGGEEFWCGCPSCRAFSQWEQNRAAVNAAAEVLAAINPAALISFYEKDGDDDGGAGPIIPLRPNLFALGKLPGEEGAADAGLFLIRGEEV